MSEDSLLTALLAVQKELPTLPKDARNPHFGSSYTPLDTIVETIQPILSKFDLIWTTLPGSDGDGPLLRYRLVHVPTAEAIEGTMPLLLPKQDMQGLGSALTYARRYALSSVLNLVADEDEDGNRASAKSEPEYRGDYGQPERIDLTDEVTDLSDTQIGDVLLHAGYDVPENARARFASVSSEQAERLRQAIAEVKR